jgi:methionine-rich copper-binding protein CopC
MSLSAPPTRSNIAAATKAAIMALHRPPPHEVRWITRVSGAAATSCATGAVCAGAATLQQSYPDANQVIEGNSVVVTLRFDGPVDHVQSSFTLVTPQGTRALQPRLRSQPNTLHGAVGTLPPGDYELQWRAVAADGETTGSIPFQVRGR